MGSPEIRAVYSPLYASNDCYISAIATFFQIPFFSAYVEFFGGLPPAPNECGNLDLRIPLDRVVGFLRARGLREHKNPHTYHRLRRPAFVIAWWDPRHGVDTLHAVVWDGKKSNSKSGSTVDGEAYAAGKRAGASINSRTQIGAGGARMLGGGQ